MQGFEQRNKEPKHTLKRFSNKKSNVLLPNLGRLWDIFKQQKTALSKELNNNNKNNN